MQKWQTKIAGVIAILTLISGALNQMMDGNPATNPDWPNIIAVIVAAFGVTMSRPNKVTSEQAGAVPPPPKPGYPALPILKDK